MTKEKTIDRIKKLLARSKSSNEHEAALAAALAAELMLDAQIEEAELSDGVDGPEEVSDETIGSDGKVVAWKMNIANGLSKSLGCEFYYQGSYKKWGGTRVKARYHAVGPKSALETISYMYTYLCTEVARLADDAYREEASECKRSRVDPPSARGWKGAFRVGCSRTIENRLIAQREKTHAKAKEEGKSCALLVVDRQKEAVSVFVKENLGRLKTGPGSSAGRGSRSGYQAGQSAGKGVSLGGSAGSLGVGTKQLGS